MAKRRTKKEKIRATARHQMPIVISTENNRTEFTISNTKTPVPLINSVKPIHNLSYVYVVKDAQKTIFITTLLITLELLIFFLLKIRLVNIPGIGF